MPGSVWKTTGSKGNTTYADAAGTKGNWHRRTKRGWRSGDTIWSLPTRKSKWYVQKQSTCGSDRRITEATTCFLETSGILATEMKMWQPIQIRTGEGTNCWGRRFRWEEAFGRLWDRHDDWQELQQRRHYDDTWQVHASGAYPQAWRGGSLLLASIAIKALQHCKDKTHTITADNGQEIVHHKKIAKDSMPSSTSHDHTVPGTWRKRKYKWADTPLFSERYILQRVDE